MRSEAPPPYPGRSWWLVDALAADRGEPCPPLHGSRDADVVIVGGGYTGLWTAHRLLELRPDLEVVVLERDICGAGPSGRNGGFLSGYWGNLGDLVGLFGTDRALALAKRADESIREIGDFCEHHGIDAWYLLAGELGVATSAAQEERWQELAVTARQFGVGDQVVELSPSGVASRVRLPYRGGGVLFPVGATVHPARLVRGLRRAVLAQGARIYEASPVTRVRPGRRALVETSGGAVRADVLVLATNAWLSRLGPFRRRVVVGDTYMVITTPAPEALASVGWTGGESLWDFRAGLTYARTTPDGRIALGLGGRVRPWRSRHIGRAFEWDAGCVAEVARWFRRLFPAFDSVPLEAAWGGPIDVSGTHLPFVLTLPPGNVHTAAGYTGNGVGPCHLAGKILARLALGLRDELTDLPIVGTAPRPFPPEPLRTFGAVAVGEAVRRKDRAEDRGRRPSRLAAGVAGLPGRFGYHLGA